MKNESKELNNSMYYLASASIWAIYVFIIKSKFTICGSLTIPYILLALWNTVNAQIAIVIKEYKREEDAYLELMGSCTLPVVAFIFIANEGHNTILVGIVLACTTLAFLYYVLSVVYNLKDKSKGKRYREKVKAISMYRTRTFLVACISLCIVIPAISRPIIKSTSRDIVQWSNERTLSANYNELKVLLNEDEFRKKSIKERQKLFEMIVDVESNHLGIPYTIEIKIQNLSNDEVANYNHEEGRIRIDREYLSKCSGVDLIDTGAHETRHAYQFEICKLHSKLKRRHDEESLVFLNEIIKNAPTYKNEFNNYTDHGEKYYRRVSEEDSRSYAAKRIKEWETIIQNRNEQDDENDI